MARISLFVIVTSRGRHYPFMLAAASSLALIIVLSFPASSPALAAPAAPAAPTAPVVGLQYDAPEGCPRQQDFVADVAARGADFRAAPPASPHRVMVIAIRRVDDGFAGTFQLRDYQTATDRREVHGPRCAEVADALAVVTAIALHPQSSEGASLPAASALPPLAAAAAPADAAPAAPASADVRLRGNNIYIHHARETVTVGPGTIAFDLARTLTLYGGVFTGAAPGTLMPRFDLSTSLATFVTTPNGDQRLVGVVTRERISFFGPGTYQGATTKTEISGFSFGVAVCPTPHYDSRGLVLLFCMEVGVGAVNLRTKGGDGMLVQSKSVDFGMAGLGIEAQYNLGSRVHVGAKVGWDAYLSPWTAEGADGNRVFTSNRSSGYALLGIGIRF